VQKLATKLREKWPNRHEHWPKLDLKNCVKTWQKLHENGFTNCIKNLAENDENDRRLGQKLF
jgi:hypothetical protein